MAALARRLAPLAAGWVCFLAVMGGWIAYGNHRDALYADQAVPAVATVTGQEVWTRGHVTSLRFQNPDQVCAVKNRWDLDPDTYPQGSTVKVLYLPGTCDYRVSGAPLYAQIAPTYFAILGTIAVAAAGFVLGSNERADQVKEQRRVRRQEQFPPMA